MIADKKKLRTLAQAVIDLEDPWYTGPQLSVRAVDAAPAELMAALNPDVVIALLDEIEELQKAVEQHAGYHAKADRLDEVEKDLERHKRIVLCAATTIGQICEVLGLDENSDFDTTIEIVRGLRKAAESGRDALEVLRRGHGVDVGAACYPALNMLRDALDGEVKP